jgi:hypothetical protein
MAKNKRIFYASHAVAFQGVNASGDAGSYITLQGGQSVSLNTDFGLEQIFQLGRLAAYDQAQINPEVEVTVAKALDGYPTIFRLATTPTSGAQNEDVQTVSIIGASSARTGIIIGVGSDTASVVSDDYDEYTAVKMTGMYFENITYTFPTDGVFTEEITFRGTHKAAHNSDAFIDGPLNPFPRGGDGKGHVLARQNFKVGGGTVLPPPVSGRCISNITISAAVTREAMYCLGSFQPFHRYVNFPLEITTTFDTMANGIGQDSSLMFDVVAGQECQGLGGQRPQVPIRIELCDSSGVIRYAFDLGSGCQLSGHTYSGGDVGGGSVTETFTYLSYNELTVEDKADLVFGPGTNDGLGTINNETTSEAGIPGQPTF